MQNTIKTFEDACKALNIKPEDVLHSAHSDALQKDIKAVNAFMKLTIIARALNEGWEPNWNDWNERKYYPWFNMGDRNASPGVGFSCHDFVTGHVASSVSSRLCYKNYDLAQYAGKQFIELYKEYMLIS